VRILSPTHRRIYPNPTSSNNGEGDVITLNVLTKSGWSPYDGPGTTDKLGYVIPESDKRLKPEAPTVRP